MLATLYRARHLIVLAAITSSAAASPSAQTFDSRPISTPSLADVMRARVPIGEVVYVTDMMKATLKGTLAAVSDDTVELNVNNRVHSIASAEVRRIQWQRPDSPLTGILIGAGIGATPGVYWYFADPNECTGLCPEEYALIGIGALAGGLIDYAIKRKETVYVAGTPSRPLKSIALGPLTSRDRRGVQVVVRF